MENGKVAGSKKLVFINGGLAQLARALAWHARGRRFDPDTLHALRLRKELFCFIAQHE